MISIADLALGIIDNVGARVRIIYAKKPPEYAVYGTHDRVLVMFADSAVIADAQRARMASLYPLRGEINGLVDGWRAKPRTRGIADAYDRRVADALIVGFEGEAADAARLLRTIKQDVLDQRIATARFEYLVAAFATGLAAMLLVALFARLDTPNEAALDLSRAAAAGEVGAFFSIALAIRGRTVLPDLQRTANLLDAALRMVIGVIAGVALMALVESGAVSIKLGDANLTSGSATRWLVVLLVGFIAGFSERFVPDLLAKASATTSAAVPPPVATPGEGEATVSGASAASAAAATPSPATAAPVDPDPEQGAVDDCACDIDVPPDELTQDVDLPAATGGVAATKAA